MGKWGLIIGSLLLLLLLFGFLWWRERQQSQKQLTSLLQALEAGISGTYQAENFTEEAGAAVIEKLNKLILIRQQQQDLAVAEKAKIQKMLSDMTHQVRTPLTTILLYSSLLQETQSLEAGHQMAQKIQHQGEKLDFYMQALVRSAYLETELIHVAPKENKLDDLLQEVCQTLEVAALKKKICFAISESQTQAVFDPKWLREAVVNVLENAIKYSPEESEVKLDVEVYEMFVAIVVEDQGIGIAEEEQGLIFQRFYRSPQVAKQKGLGIGLYLVREIMEKQQGYVKIQSKLGQGSRFLLYLPRT